MWKKINDFVCRYRVLSAFLCAVLFVVLLTLVGLPTMQGTMEVKTGMAILTVYQIVMAVVGMFLMKKLQLFDEDDYSFRDIGKGILQGWVMLLLALLMVVVNYFSRSNYFIKPDILFVLISIIFPFSTGLLEEIVCRGLILKILLKKTDNTKETITKALIVSALLFGLAHLIHLFWASPIEVLSDFIVAFVGGLFLGAVYLRTKTLIVPILLHGIFNLSNIIFVPFTSLEFPVSQATFSDVIVVSVLISPLVISAFALLKKSINKNQANQNEKTEVSERQ